MLLSRPDLADKLVIHFFTLPFFGPLGNQFVIVHAPDANEARQVMDQAFGGKWDHIYEVETEFESQTKEEDLNCLCEIMPDERGIYRAFQVKNGDSLDDSSQEPADNKQES